MQGEADVPEPIPARHSLDPQDLGAASAGRGRIVIADVAVGHQPNQIGGGRGKRHGRYQTSIPQHGGAVADPPELFHPVRDVDDADAAGGQPPDRREQPLDLRLGERRCRLVHHQDAGVERQRLRHFDHLLFGDTEQPYGRLGIDRNAKPGEQARRIGGQPSAVDDACAAHRLPSEEDVRRRGEVGDQRELLVDGADPGELSLPRGVERHRPAVEQDLSGIARAGTAQDLHQRRFAGAVLAEQHVHLARAQLEAHVIEGDDARVAFADAPHQQQRRLGSGLAHGRRASLWRARRASIIRTPQSAAIRIPPRRELPNAQRPIPKCHRLNSHLLGNWEWGVGSWPKATEALRWTSGNLLHSAPVMANIYDVAKEARVSLATVSAVVNDSAYVSPGLKTRVHAAIQKLAYQPNLVARGLAKQQTRTIGMIAPNIANPFWPEVVRGVEDAVHAAGYTLLLASNDDDRSKESRYLRMFLAKRVDGLLLTKAVGPLDAETTALLRAARTPIVQLMRTTSALQGDKVLVDEREGVYEGVAHLLRLGHRRIAMINGVEKVSTSAQRLAGYRDALRDWQVEHDATLVAHGDFRVESGYTAGIQLLKQKPDAFFIGNYLMAVGFMRALRQYQLRCPEDVAIVTCDDHPWLDSFHPRLTTVNLPKYELGQAAALALMQRLQPGGDPPSKRARVMTLKTSLCVRDSCGYTLRRGTSV
jgi:LacI family transcriptional regulator